MKGTILIYQPQQSRPQVQAIDGEPTLETLKDAIGGGYLEVVPHFCTIEHGDELRNCVTFCDEDGKRKELQVNLVATSLWDKAMRAATGIGCNPDYLVGPIAVVFGDRQFMEAL